jgi:hypothetical protein
MAKELSKPIIPLTDLNLPWVNQEKITASGNFTPLEVRSFMKAGNDMVKGGCNIQVSASSTVIEIITIGASMFAGGIIKELSSDTYGFAKDKFNDLFKKVRLEKPVTIEKTITKGPRSITVKVTIETKSDWKEFPNDEHRIKGLASRYFDKVETYSLLVYKYQDKKFILKNKVAKGF